MANYEVRPVIHAEFCSTRPSSAYSTKEMGSYFTRFTSKHMTLKVTLDITRTTLNLKDFTWWNNVKAKAFPLAIKNIAKKFAFAYQNQSQLQNRQNITMHLEDVATITS